MTTASLQVLPQAGALDRMATAAEIRAQVNLIQEVMKAVMKDGTHFGTIPGTDKPTLYKAGAEKILMTFRIAAQASAIEDLAAPDEIRYRVTVRGVSQNSGVTLGEGVGECSSNEEKYRWRRPVHDNEWTAAPEDRRREKWTRNGDTWRQVRTEPADVANTILKMAHKRALVAMTLVVTAASDVFTQDIEDLPEELQDAATEATRKPMQAPQRKAAEAKTTAPTERVVGTVTEVSKGKSGEKNGKPWQVWKVKLSDLKVYGTFDEPHKAVADEALRTGEEVAVDWKDGRYGRELLKIAIIEKPAAPEPADNTPVPESREPGAEG
jgi:hypothetical protein